MISIIKLTFNPFQENTYIVFDETKECVIFDPGCINVEEKKLLTDVIEAEGLKPVRLVNTHCHLDHVFGNKFVADTYNLGLEIHRGELDTLNATPEVAMYYGVPMMEESPAPSRFLEEGEQLTFGNSSLDILLTPGHSPASLCFYDKKGQHLIAGDVLFYESIGRTDLPGGDHATLIDSIKNKLMLLDDEVRVYPGHGPDTTIGHERTNNPFF